MISLEELRREADRMLRKMRGPIRPRHNEPALRERGLLAGYDGKDPQYVPFREFGKHGLVIGKSGVGKTQFLYSVICQMAMAGYNVVVIDGKGGDFIRDLLIAAHRLRRSPEQIILIDPGNRQREVGLNLLQVPNGWVAENHGRRLHEALRRLNREGTDAKPWLDELMPLCLSPMAAVGGISLHELFNFTSVDDASFRNVVLDKVGDRLAPIYRQQWRELAQLGPSELAMRTSVIRTRGSWIQTSPALVPVIGAAETTVDWDRVLNHTPGSLVLADLGLSSSLSEDQSRLVGLGILTMVVNTLLERKNMPKEERRPTFIVVDEADRFIDRLTSLAFDKLRSFAAGCILSVQHLSQLRTVDEFVYRSVITSSNVKASFAASYDDALVIAQEIGRFNLKEVKEERYETRFDVPVETERLVESWGESSGSSWSDGRSQGAGGGQGRSESETMLESNRTPITNSSGSAHHDSWSEANSSSSGGSSGTSYTKSRVPFTRHDARDILAAREFWSLPEHYERLVRAVGAQGVQHYALSVGGEAPKFLRSPTIHPLKFDEGALEDLILASLELYARPRDAVLRGIASRVPRFIAEHRPRLTLVNRADRRTEDAPVGATVLDINGPNVDAADDDFVAPITFTPRREE